MTQRDEPDIRSLHVAPTGVEVFEGVACVTIGDVLLTLWASAAQPQRIHQVTLWTEALIARHPEGIAACQFLLSSASPPKRAGRIEARKGFSIVEPNARRLITVPLGNAFWRTLVRTIIRAAVRLAGNARLVKVAANKEKAFDLLTEVSTPRSPNREQLEAGLEALYSALDVPLDVH